jgi:hypothetical protein
VVVHILIYPIRKSGLVKVSGLDIYCSFIDTTSIIAEIERQMRFVGPTTVDFVVDWMRLPDAVVVQRHVASDLSRII